MNIYQARPIAEKWVERLTPACERIAIAGSIRRGKEEVSDIDIVCIPKISSGMDMFGSPLAHSVNHLDDILLEGRQNGDFTIFNPFDLSERTVWGPRQKKLYLPERIKLELWIVQPPAQWGVIYTIRTGPREFGKWLVTNRNKGGALPSNYKIKDGAVWSSNHIIPTPEEMDFFDLLGVPYVEPNLRKPLWR